MADYQGRHVWIIGAGSGIGRALAVELAGQGAVLALSGRGKDKLDSLNRQLGGGHHVYPVDVADGSSLAKAAKAIQSAWPKLDSVVFMAAVYEPVTLDRMDMASVRRTVDINLNGAFNTVHAVLPIFTAQKGGQIALCASVAGYRGLPRGQPYSATKAAIINLAESLRCEQGGEGIDVKVINPGFVKTPMTDQNDFPMPMIIAPEQAAKAVAKGLQSRAFEIHFPKRFTLLMKLLRLLPAPLFFWIGKRADKG